jgi:hypothetical protein
MPKERSILLLTLPYIEGATPPLGGTQTQFQDLTSMVKKSEAPLLIIYDVNAVPANTAITFYSDGGAPDYWRVSIRPSAGVRVSVYKGPESSGIPIRLGGGGKLKLPIPTEYITLLVEVGSNPASGNVVAVRKYPDFDLDAGDVA